ncbi:MAG: ArsA family ATPase [Myxococcales bacterium]|nr:ArsA family ATPase [Myxococcales bacterium]
MKPVDWLERQILVCAGTGGVGKTTLAAAIGLEAALRGRRVLVVTIDPARRLADAFGVGRLGSVPREIPPERIARALGGRARGTLHAMMLDTKRTFDALVERFAPDRDSRDRIFENAIYQTLTDALAGSREYAATEEVLRLHGKAEYDLLVLDTPPARHALDFLDAPRRLIGFLESPVARLLVLPTLAVGRTGRRWFRLGSDRVLRALERFSGLELPRAIAEFLVAFEGLVDGFATRAHEVQRLLSSPACGVVLVAGTGPGQSADAARLRERLAEERIDLAGIVVNRIRSWPGPEPCPQADDPRWETDEARLAAALDAEPGFSNPKECARILIQAARRQAQLARRDERAVAAFARDVQVPIEEIRRIPLEAQDPHSLEALAGLGRKLFGCTDPGRPAEAPCE